MIATEIDTYQEQHAALPSDGSPDWLAALRQRGIEAFTKLGLPTRRLEDWRFTNIKALASPGYELAWRAAPQGGSAEDEIASLVSQATLDADYHRLVFVNGLFNAEHSQILEESSGVTIRSLADCLENGGSDLPEHAASSLSLDNSAFAALNTALMSGGAVIDVADGVSVEKPIHLLFLSVGEGRIASHPRNFVRLGKKTTANVIESFVGNGDAYFNNVVTQVSLAEEARLDHHKLQQEKIGALHLSLTSVTQKANSDFRSHYFSFGGSIARNEVECLLDGEHIETTLNGLYMPTGDQLMDCRTTIDHAMPNCNSYELYKGILDDKSKGVFNGKIFVRQDAQKTDAKQSNQAMLLSDDAVVDTKPQLEIYADDVRCTHGATIGELEEDAMYYLRSRGIPNDLARQILIFAFANDVVQGVGLAAVRNRLESVLLDGHELSEDIIL